MSNTIYGSRWISSTVSKRRPFCWKRLYVLEEEEAAGSQIRRSSIRRAGVERLSCLYGPNTRVFLTHHERVRCHVGAHSSRGATVQGVYAECSLSVTSGRYSRTQHWQSGPSLMVIRRFWRTIREISLTFSGVVLAKGAQTSRHRSVMFFHSWNASATQNTSHGSLLSCCRPASTFKGSPKPISQVRYRIWSLLSAQVWGPCCYRKLACGCSHKNTWSTVPHVHSMTPHGMLTRNWLLLIPVARAWLSRAWFVWNRDSLGTYVLIAPPIIKTILLFFTLIMSIMCDTCT